MEYTISFLKDFFATDIRFHPVYLVPFFVIGFLVFFFGEKKKKGFWSWLFPKEIYFHASHIVDLKLFVVGRLLVLTKAFYSIFVQVAFAVVGMGIVWMLTGLENSTQETTLPRILMATLIITITNDFCVYWVHRFHHETPIIWPFHAVHHSAEVMTPVTVYRKHPVYDVVSDFVKAVLTGFIQGVILMLLIGKIEISLIAGINAFYFAFNFLGSNFRHSHIWISYGRALEHVLISPAQHQIHHSLEPKHHNKNYGEIFAFWDWLFGTLYIPTKKEIISYGISKSSTSNERIEQPHPTLKAALVKPFQESKKAYQRHKKKQREKKEA